MPYYYKLQIKDAQKLEEAEHLLVSTRLAELYKNPIKIKSVKDICAIHKYLFQDIYSWAGRFRGINISKEGRPFLAFQSFPKASEYIDELIKNVRNADSRERMITSFAELLDHLNHMHPFS